MSREPAAERISGYDVARAIAIFGMVIHHFLMAMTGAGPQQEWFTSLLVLFDGRPAVLFLILAGIGITLRTRKACQANDAAMIAQERRSLLKRAVILLVLGYVNLIIWPGDILRVYGISLLIAAGLITATSRRLLLTALAFPVGFAVLLCLMNYEENWDWSTMTYHHLWTPAGSLRNLFYDGFRSVFPFSGFIFFGMWLGRLDLTNQDLNRRVLRISLGVVLAAQAISAFIVWKLTKATSLNGITPAEIRTYFGTESMPPFPLFLAAAGGAAVATITLCVRLSQSGLFKKVTSALAPTGRMALTWYFLHIYLGLGAVMALGAIGNQTTAAALVTGIMFCLIATIMSMVWTRFFRHGPLEWGLRLLAA